MTFSITRTLMLAGFAIVLPALPALAFSADNISNGLSARPADVQLVANKYECFTDDGYGRKRPCSAGYKRQNPNWRSSSECFTDEGYGRYRPCDSFFKRNVTKN